MSKNENFSVSKTLNSIGWDSLENKRNEAKLAMAYKIVTNKVILTPDYFFPMKYLI